MEKVYDIIIVGGGPAGLTAAIYALMAKKSVLLLERLLPGGQVSQVLKIKNFPGFESVDGLTLAERMFSQAEGLGLETRYADVLEYSLEGEIKTLITTDGNFSSKCVILSLGAVAKELNVKDEKKFVGRGLSYCATCDGNFFAGKTVAIVGGDNSMVEDALYLAGVAKRVYVIHRHSKLEATPALEALEKSEKVVFLTNSQVTQLIGEVSLEKIEVQNKVTKEKSLLEIDGLFVALGKRPDTSLLKSVKLDENGYILTDENMHTNIDGVYAAGDIRRKKLRQIVTACADGAIAGTEAIEYLSRY